MNLYDKLIEYSRDDYYPMHMPGHKRNAAFSMTNPYSIDITEIEGFDNLHHAEGILLEGMEQAAKLYNSKHTNYLIGGSTAGLLTAIGAAANKGDKVMVARNCHKAVYHGIYLNELHPVYIYPQADTHFNINGGISPEKIEELLIKHKDIKLIILTSPTYEGVISDIPSISRIAHKHKVPLLVDEAHGAHLGFHTGFPDNSIQAGADIVIHSLHKTLPAFTQTGLIHVNSDLVDYEKIKKYLGIYQTSSPSYLLMASIDRCITLLLDKRKELFDRYYNLLQNFYDHMKALKNLKILFPDNIKNYGFYKFDPSKITISVKNTDISGIKLYDMLLKEYKIQMEMVTKDYVLGMTSICDTTEGLHRLSEALLDIDKKLESISAIPGKHLTDKTEVPEWVMSSWKADNCLQESIPLTLSEGRISGDYVYLYPPGIPLLVPGERISKSLLEDIYSYQREGLHLQGLQDEKGQYIKVIL
ncbi:aminotransferase class I/II-fold pyridoxal phosphate-dependent enzyme [Anaerocolumna sp.]|uniref:aminotransferase class I/II-fold pyridoxal phosphate-dependent enzyme n=1 Tax=Anaerocolumna sp. TaxID=2041569 RepID=UPI0028A5A34B|nr:aminotransferase class I/II-fold pyridoxal phosphate-dependent enzyme [Anaerocolumna sp.]